MRKLGNKMIDKHSEEKGLTQNSLIPLKLSWADEVEVDEALKLAELEARATDEDSMPDESVDDIEYELVDYEESPTRMG